MGKNRKGTNGGIISEHGTDNQSNKYEEFTTDNGKHTI